MNITFIETCDGIDVVVNGMTVDTIDITDYTGRSIKPDYDFILECKEYFLIHTWQELQELVKG